MDRREYPTASLGSETLASRIYCPMELATDENTLLELPPIRRMVPTTITRITASMTAYSAMSCPCSSRHSSNKNFFIIQFLLRKQTEKVPFGVAGCNSSLT